MRHYIPWPTKDGGYAVAYMNHRGELIAVMECPDLNSAYVEAAHMTAASITHALPYTNANGNRYLRRFQ